jgi:D-glycero-alpha-D-manno-heptose-7-phosphate kinase
VGGTLDLWPIHSFVEEAWTLNAGIDIKTWAKLHVLPDGDPRVRLRPFEGSWQEFAHLAEFIEQAEESTKLIRELLLSMKPHFGFELEWGSSSPVGGGLGGSSSLLVSFVKVFAQAMGLQRNIYDWIHWAHNVESRILRAPAGVQDYYPPFTGGACLIHFSDQGTDAKVLPVRELGLPPYSFLSHTGRAHHSGMNNFDVLTRLVRGDAGTWQHLRALKANADRVVQHLQRGEPVPWVEVFHKEYEHRCGLSPAFGSPEISRIAELVTRADPSGGSMVKILGAGGGGLVWVLTDQAHKLSLLKQSLGEAGFAPLDFAWVPPLITAFHLPYQGG